MEQVLETMHGPKKVPCRTCRAFSAEQSRLVQWMACLWWLLGQSLSTVWAKGGGHQKVQEGPEGNEGTWYHCHLWRGDTRCSHQQRFLPNLNFLISNCFSWWLGLLNASFCLMTFLPSTGKGKLWWNGWRARIYMRKTKISLETQRSQVQCMFQK